MNERKIKKKILRLNKNVYLAIELSVRHNAQMGVKVQACNWPKGSRLMQQYHDEEWCIPSRDETYLFEMLILEGAQAGLSWNTVLTKREEYKEAFHNFDIAYCASLTDEQIQKIRDDYQVIKNILKLRSVKTNAQAFQKIQKQEGSFADFLWGYVDGHPIDHCLKTEDEMPAKDTLSEEISKELKKRGFKFVGPVIIYSYMQAVGMIDDHIQTCPCHTKNRNKK